MPRPRSSAQPRRPSVRALDTNIAKSAARLSPAKSAARLSPAKSRLSPPTSPPGNKLQAQQRSFFSRNVSLSTRFKDAHGDEDLILESNHKHRWVEAVFFFRCQAGGC